MAITISNAFITKLQMASDGSYNIIEDFAGTAGVITPSGSTGGGGNSGGAGWYFYSDEGYTNADPPINNGNTIFLDIINGVETFDPNQQGGTTLLLHFNVNDSAGTSYSSQFSDASQQFSTVTITQGSNVAEYFNGSGAGMSVTTMDGVDVFIIDTTNCLQTQTSASPFNANDVITLAFS